MPRPIIIDTDPGTDDAVAILLALAAPELDLLGLAAVAGNAPLVATERNARAVLELAAIGGIDERQPRRQRVSQQHARRLTLAAVQRRQREGDDVAGPR